MRLWEMMRRECWARFFKAFAFFFFSTCIDVSIDIRNSFDNAKTRNEIRL